MQRCRPLGVAEKTDAAPVLRGIFLEQVCTNVTVNLVFYFYSLTVISSVTRPIDLLHVLSLRPLLIAAFSLFSTPFILDLRLSGQAVCFSALLTAMTSPSFLLPPSLLPLPGRASYGAY